LFRRIEAQVDAPFDPTGWCYTLEDDPCKFIGKSVLRVYDNGEEPSLGRVLAYLPPNDGENGIYIHDCIYIYVCIYTCTYT
jgi:hypothetical protein